MAQPTAPAGDLGEILETGGQTSKPTPTPKAPQRPAFAKASAGDAGLDWLEKMAPQVKKSQNKPSEEDEQLKQKQQLERLKKLDDKRSREMYEAIQQEILKLEKQREEEKRRGMTKNITGATGFDKQQIEDPEAFQKKQLEQQKKATDDLSAATKASMGTGEANRGAIG